ncbi:MAG: hypothetical protein AAB509_02195 [Patescibacteria group bacterium]
MAVAKCLDCWTDLVCEEMPDPEGELTGTNLGEQLQKDYYRKLHCPKCGAEYELVKVGSIERIEMREFLEALLIDRRKQREDAGVGAPPAKS